MIQSLNAFMFHHLPIAEIFDIAFAAGVKTVSLEPKHLHEKTLGELQAKYDIAINSVGAVFLDLDNPNACCKDATEMMQKCGRLGIPAINLVLVSKREMHDWLVDAVKICGSLGETARQNHVELNIEPLNPNMRDISCITDLSQAVILCRYLDSSIFGITLDLYHVALMKNVEYYIKELLPRVRVIHLSDVDLNDKPCQPGMGRMWFKKYLFEMIDYHPDITIELEVCSDGFASYCKEELIRYVITSFINVSKTIVIGELCIHKYVNDEGCISECTVGGGAGVISSQINALGSTSYLVGICGNDSCGNKITEEHQSEYGFSYIVKQKNGHTADVELSRDKINIVPGDICIALLGPIIDKLATKGCTVYLPVFPAYENIYKILSGRENRLICDFGYFEWCGKKTAIEKRLHDCPKGYCALINAKNLDENTKQLLGEKAVRNYGYEYAIITDGGNDVFLVDKNTCRRYSVVKTDAISECGAGDSMIAGMLYMLEHGCKMEAALVYGISVAYKKIQKNGVWKV